MISLPFLSSNSPPFWICYLSNFTHDPHSNIGARSSSPQFSNSGSEPFILSRFLQPHNERTNPPFPLQSVLLPHIPRKHNYFKSIRQTFLFLPSSFFVWRLAYVLLPTLSLFFCKLLGRNSATVVLNYIRLFFTPVTRCYTPLAIIFITTYCLFIFFLLPPLYTYSL